MIPLLLILFVTQIELLSKEVQELPAITFCTQLEQRVVVGAYDMVIYLSGFCVDPG